MGLVNNQLAYNRHLIWHEGYGILCAGKTDIGLYFEVRIPNFRGNYLSCIESLEFTIDNKAVPEERIAFILNGKRFRIKDFPELYMEYWDVLDRAVCEITYDGELRGEHTISAVMKMRYAYSAYFGKCKVVTSECERTFKFE